MSPAAPAVTAPSPSRREDALRRGPQGNVAQFVVECELSHLAYDDPIVHPGMAGMSHLHQFFGNAEVDSDPTYEGVSGAETSCERRSDTASYWAPALLDARGEVIEPYKLTAYYRPGPGIDPASVEPYPAGLMMVAGDAFAEEQQPVETVAWGCGAGSTRDPQPPDCRGHARGRSRTDQLAGSAPLGDVPRLLGRRDRDHRRRVDTRGRQRRRALSGIAPGADPAAPDGDRLPSRRSRRAVPGVRRHQDSARRLLERVGPGRARGRSAALPESRSSCAASAAAAALPEPIRSGRIRCATVPDQLRTVPRRRGSCLAEPPGIAQVLAVGLLLGDRINPSAHPGRAGDGPRRCARR